MIIGAKVPADQLPPLVREGCTCPWYCNQHPPTEGGEG